MKRTAGIFPGYGQSGEGMLAQDCLGRNPAPAPTPSLPRFGGEEAILFGRQEKMGETKPLSMNRVNGHFDICFPLTPSLSLGERVNHFTPLVCTSCAVDLKPSRQMLLPLPKGEGWCEGEGSARNPLLAGQTRALENHHEPDTLTGSKREFSFWRNLSPRCVAVRGISRRAGASLRPVCLSQIL